MRGDDLPQDAVFSHISREAGGFASPPANPPVDAALAELSLEFDRLYAHTGRPSVPRRSCCGPPTAGRLNRPLRAAGDGAAGLDHNLLFSRCAGFNMDDPLWDPTTFTKNCQRLLDAEIAERFFKRSLAQASARGLLSTSTSPWTVPSSRPGRG